MNIKETEKLLLSIAEQRLKLIPGAYDSFRMHHACGSALPLHVLSAGSVRGSTSCLDAINPRAAFHRRAIEYVDSWAEKYSIPPVEPLAPRVAPLLPARGVDISAPSIELKALRNAGPSNLKPPKTPDELEPPAATKPLQRQPAQENEILAAIRAAGYDPLSLPARQPGKRGIKSEIRARLVGKTGNFPTDGSQFDKAWIRLRADGRIVD